MRGCSLLLLVFLAQVSHRPTKALLPPRRSASGSGRRDGLGRELKQLMSGVSLLRCPETYSLDRAKTELKNVETSLAVFLNAPLIGLAAETAATGTYDSAGFLLCSACAFVMAIAHAVLYTKTPRDLRAPRLGEAQTTYQYSAVYGVAFAWLLFRMNAAYPAALESLDAPMALVSTAVILYGFVYPLYGKFLMKETKEGRKSAGPLQPTDSDVFYEKTQLLLSGQTILNVLAALFLPFIWVLCVRGSDWWLRVQELHPNQAALMGLTILVGTLGNTLGTLLMMFDQFKIVRSFEVVVLLGLVSNVAFLVFPEVAIHGFYRQGFSELLFYWE